MNLEITTIAATLALGFVAGILSGMFGIGGGLVIVPALVFFFGLGQKAATGTSMFALLWPVGLLGVYAYWDAKQLDVSKGAIIAVGIFLGAFFGAKITLALPTSTVKRAYAVFLVTVGIYYFLTTKPSPAKPIIPGPEPSAAPDQVH
jgi:uncharacterized protein